MAELGKHLTLDREQLQLGKYTSWAAGLSTDELHALLWMVGEYGVRSCAEDAAASSGHDGRREAGRKAIVRIVSGQPMTLEQAKAAIRSAS